MKVYGQTTANSSHSENETFNKFDRTTELQRFMGISNQLGQFSLHLAQLSQL